MDNVSIFCARRRGLLRANFPVEVTSLRVLKNRLQVDVILLDDLDVATQLERENEVST